MQIVSLLSNVHTKLLTTAHAKAVICGPLCGKAQVQVSVSKSIFQQIGEFFTKLFNTDDFPARWHCGNWTDFHGWLYIISDITTWAAYFAIPVMLFRVLRKRKDVPFNGMILLFLAFVFLCGFTHLVDALIFWWPVYRLSALLRFATAIVSIIAAYALSRVFPLLLGLRSIRELKIEIERRKKIEERLSASEFLLSEAGRIASVGGWEIDLISGNCNWSRTVYDILEIPYDQEISQAYALSHCLKQYRTLMKQSINNAIHNGNKWDIEALIVTQKKKTLWVRYIGEPVFNSSDEVVKLRGTIMDIDQYKKHELELSRSLEVTLEQKQQLKNFAYVLSHNIRNHTSNLTGLAAMIDLELVDEDNKNVILKSRQVTTALSTTLDDLAEVIEAQDQTTALEEVSFATVAADAIAAQSVQIEQVQARIVQHFDVPIVYFSSLYMSSVFKQLLSNAIRYRDPAKNLQIELSTCLNSEGNIVLKCKDNGLGMDQELYGHRLFGLYNTFHPSISSRGVGLYLIKTQVESLGGKIAVNSTPGQGSAFDVIFPSKS